MVIIPCSADKAARPAPAAELYTGSYHRLARAAAETLTATGGRILILSGLHGLLTPDRVIAPYDHRMGQPGSVTPSQLRSQAGELGVADADEVVVLAGRAYAEAVQPIWEHALLPLAGSRGIGDHRARLSLIRDQGMTTK
ncbi:DUF6884 domain-containing protein [Nocardiopsis sp. NPDC006198]|uniref:DUF6884 domain-containing protein n=1 Tax=Nocardiopsis sp. NPDC006198 TaxID=3154472 RepID=UPI0033ADD91F